MEHEFNEGFNSYIEKDEALYSINLVSNKRNEREESIAVNNRPKRKKELEEIASRVSAIAHEPFNVKDMERYMKTQQFLVNPFAICQQRIENDIFYGLLLYPHSKVETVDTETGDIIEITLINKICYDMLDYFEKRYEECIANDYLIAPVFARLRITTNSRLKLFAILFMYTLDESMMRFFTSLCGKNGFRNKSVYRKMRTVLTDTIYRMRHAENINSLNINSVVNDLNHIALRCYTRPNLFDKIFDNRPAEIRRRN